jgi:hypothetical protein
MRLASASVVLRPADFPGDGDRMVGIVTHSAYWQTKCRYALAVSRGQQIRTIAGRPRVFQLCRAAADEFCYDVTAVPSTDCLGRQ